MDADSLSELVVFRHVLRIEEIAGVRTILPTTFIWHYLLYHVVLVS